MLLESDASLLITSQSLGCYASILAIEAASNLSSSVRVVHRGFLYLDTVFMFLFLLEIGVHLFVYGLSHLRRPVNAVDLTAVVVCAVFSLVGLIAEPLVPGLSLLTADQVSSTSVLVVRSASLVDKLYRADVGSRLRAFLTRLLRHGLSDSYSTQWSIYLLCAFLFNMGLIFAVLGYINAYEINNSKLLNAVLPDVSGNGILSTGLAILVVSIVWAAVTFHSPSQRVTLALLVALFVVLVGLSTYTTSLAKPYTLSLTQGRAMHYNLDAAPGEPEERAAVEEALQLWRQMQEGFEQAYTQCNGTIYNTSSVNAACARHVPGADCAHNTPDRFALFCRNQFGSRKLTVNALFHAEEWDPAYEYGGANAGGDSYNDAFDWIISTMCLYPGGRDPWSLVDRQCNASKWWPYLPPETGPALSGAERAADAAVFADLGGGDMASSAKLLFCLCDGSPEYMSMIQRYINPVSILAALMLGVALVATTILFCLCCCVEDADRYYDPELL